MNSLEQARFSERRFCRLPSLSWFTPITIFVMAPGAFFVLACLVALQNYIKIRLKKAGKPNEKIGSGCTEDCMNCSDKGCKKRFYDTTKEIQMVDLEEEEEK